MIKELSSQNSLDKFLAPYKASFEKHLREHVDGLGEETALKKAVEYSVFNGGKRLRPLMVMIISEALDFQLPSFEAAISIEYLHTASLIADDLPCMDNDDERRNKPSLHKKYGDSVALLTTYALIAAGYRCLVEACEAISKKDFRFYESRYHICVLALENVTHNTGIFGITGGQWSDLSPSDYSLNTLISIIDKKTVPLFESAFILGWLFGGGNLNSLGLVKEIAKHFGRAFQMADDLDDYLKDKNNPTSCNLAKVFGKEKTKDLFYYEMTLLQEKINHLPYAFKELKLFIKHFKETVEELH